MHTYTVLIKWYAIICLSISVLLSIIGLYYPKKIVASSTINILGYTFVIFSIAVGIILSLVYYLIFKPEKDFFTILTNYSVVQSIFFWIFLVYFFGTLFLINGNLENGLTTTSGKLLLFLGLSMNWSYYLLVSTINILKK